MPELQSLSRAGLAIVLKWKDGRSQTLAPADLRRACPCALCVNEVTGLAILDPNSVEDDIQILDMQPVGNYAYRLLFSDTHDSGIYRLELLRKLV
jgi:ATP-binding protein involved in chromosome partitioning